MSKRKNHRKNRKYRYQGKFKEARQRAKNYCKQQADLISGLKSAVETARKCAERIKAARALESEKGGNDNG